MLAASQTVAFAGTITAQTPCWVSGTAFGLINPVTGSSTSPDKGSSCNGTLKVAGVVTENACQDAAARIFALIRGMY